MCRVSRKKTLENINKLMGCLHDSVLLFRLKERIQLEQIRKDIKKESNDKALSWIQENAREYRYYLERIEQLARKYKDNPERKHELFSEIDILKEELS